MKGLNGGQLMRGGGGTYNNDGEAGAVGLMRLKSDMMEAGSGGESWSRGRAGKWMERDGRMDEGVESLGPAHFAVSLGAVCWC